MQRNQSGAKGTGRSGRPGRGAPGRAGLTCHVTAAGSAARCDLALVPCNTMPVSVPHNLSCLLEILLYLLEACGTRTDIMLICVQTINYHLWQNRT